MTEPPSAPLPSVLRTLAEWHRDAFDPDDPDRQARARLRRVGSVAEVPSDAGLVYFRLKREVEVAGADEVWTPRDWLPFVASLLPYLKPTCPVDGRRDVDCWREHEDDLSPNHRCRFTLAKRLGERDQRRASSNSVDLRFRRLIAHERLDDDFRLALTRALRLVDGQVCLWCLARDLSQWDPKAFSHPRQNWADDYYSTLLHEPSADA